MPTATFPKFLRAFLPTNACNKLHHPAISPEQGASKIVKISQQMAKLCRKLKWLVFFWESM